MSSKISGFTVCDGLAAALAHIIWSDYIKSSALLSRMGF